ncbi:cysteine hydrolase family protein [Niallia taxi]|uniref:cysteine hydrolase family protein n=1 Tax=Niallia TaxID=2837506 RepID=UPI003982904F
MGKTVLLVVDVQEALMAEHPYNEQKLVENIKLLISAARDNNQEVIYVQHEDDPGEELERNTDGWRVFSAIAPINKEKRFGKRYNSAFLKTGLTQYLQDNETSTIVLVGLQTEYCIDSTCKSAFELGFEVIIPEETNSTYDNEFLSGEKTYQFYNYKIWNKRFAKVVPVKEAVELLARR